MSMFSGGKVQVAGLMDRQDSCARFFDSVGMKNSAASPPQRLGRKAEHLGSKAWDIESLF